MQEFTIPARLRRLRKRESMLDSTGTIDVPLGELTAGAAGGPVPVLDAILKRGYRDGVNPVEDVAVAVRRQAKRPSPLSRVTIERLHLQSIIAEEGAQPLRVIHREVLRLTASSGERVLRESGTRLF